MAQESKIGLGPIREAIRRRLREEGRTLASLSRATGIQRTQLSNYLAGRANLGAAAQDRCLAALGLRIQILPVSESEVGGGPELTSLLEEMEWD